jgi:CRISPR-associated protein Cas1
VEPLDLYVTSPGTTVRIRDGLLRVETGEVVESFPPRRVRSMVLGAPSKITTDALRAAVLNDVDIVVLDRRGQPLGRFWAASPGGAASLRRLQLEAATGPRGEDLARGLVLAKLAGQREHLADLKRRRKKPPPELAQGVEAARRAEQRVGATQGPLSTLTASLRGIEGTSARAYFAGLASVVPARWRFQGRSRRPALDAFNALLNYAYGVLYGKVERAVVLAGLDPYLGILHADAYGQRTLVYDLIEPVRVEADRVVLALFTRKQIKDSHVEDDGEGVRLSRIGKGLLLDALARRFEGRVEVEGRKVRRSDALLLRAHAFSRALRGDDGQLEEAPGEGPEASTC